MQNVKIVTPAAFSSMNMSWNLNLFSGPKATIRCGECQGTFTHRIPLIDYPTIVCPFCGTLNRIPVVCV